MQKSSRRMEWKDIGMYESGRGGDAKEDQKNWNKKKCKSSSADQKRRAVEGKKQFGGVQKAE